MINTHSIVTQVWQGGTTVHGRLTLSDGGHSFLDGGDECPLGGGQFVLVHTLTLRKVKK